MFVDRVTIYVKGGDGGNGCLSFRREKYAPRGGPNGGDGGRGGHVIVRAAQGHTNLAHLSHQRHWRADRGEHGQGSDCTGRNADDLVIEVPPGTIVRDRDRGHVLRDLKRDGDSVVVVAATATRTSSRPPTAPRGRSRRASRARSAGSTWS
jgi:GTP-binding protein